METEMKWVDETGYSQSDKIRVPRIWTMRSLSLAVSVHRLHGAERDKWYMSCHTLDMVSVPLEQGETRDAQTEALQRVSARITELADAVRAMEYANAFLVKE